MVPCISTAPYTVNLWLDTSASHGCVAFFALVMLVLPVIWACSAGILTMPMAGMLGSFRRPYVMCR